MSTALELDHLLNPIEESSDPRIGSHASSQFMLECLALVEQRLPPLAMEAAQSVSHYLAGRLNLDAIIDIRSKCWRRIDECRQTGEGDSSEVIAIRAAIFPLHAQEHPIERDLVDNLSAFLAFVNRVEPHFDEEEALLRKHFANSLESNESQ